MRAAEGLEGRQCDGADVAFGDLPVVLEPIVRQPRRERQEPRAGTGFDLQADDVERLDIGEVELLRRDAADALAWPPIASSTWRTEPPQPRACNRPARRPPSSRPRSAR
jgi:hypothetical protein